MRYLRRLVGVFAVGVVVIGCGGGSSSSSSNASSASTASSEEPKADPTNACSLVSVEDLTDILGEPFTTSGDPSKDNTCLFSSSSKSRFRNGGVGVNTNFTTVDELRAFKEQFGIEKTVDIGDGGFVSGDRLHALVDFIKNGLHVSVNFTTSSKGGDALSSSIVDDLVEVAALVESRM